MIGNAYENAIQSSVTIHGTHHSLVDNNVMWNSRNGPSNRIFCREQSNARTAEERSANHGLKIFSVPSLDIKASIESGNASLSSAKS